MKNRFSPAGRRKRRLLTTGISLACLALVAACAPKTELRGNLPRDYQMAEVEVGKVNKNQVARALGSPSVLGTFDSDIWYYMSRRTEQWAFLEEDLVEQQVLVLYFDKAGILERMERFSEEDVREIAYSDEVTPTAGRKLNFFEQIFGNFGRGAIGN